MVNKKNKSLPELRANYYRLIYQYKQRKAKIKKQRNVEIKTITQKYARKTEKLNSKIKSWSRAIRRIDARASKIEALKRLVEEFTDSKITKYGRGNKIARYLFFEFGFRRHIMAIDLLRYANIHRAYSSTEYRKEFRILRKTNPEIEELWNRFNNYVKLNTDVFNK